MGWVEGSAACRGTWPTCRRGNATRPDDGLLHSDEVASVPGEVWFKEEVSWVITTKAVEVEWRSLCVSPPRAKGCSLSWPWLGTQIVLIAVGCSLAF